MTDPRTQILGYRWYDPDAGLGSEPTIEITIYRDPNMRSPERLSHELRYAIAELLTHLKEPFHDDSSTDQE